MTSRSMLVYDSLPCRFVKTAAAAAVIAAIFPVILALMFQKYLVFGLTAGGVRG